MCLGTCTINIPANHVTERRFSSETGEFRSQGPSQNVNCGRRFSAGVFRGNIIRQFDPVSVDLWLAMRPAACLSHDQSDNVGDRAV